MRKRILATFLVLAMLVTSMLSGSTLENVMAAEAGTATIVHEGRSNDVTWSIDDAGLLLITGSGDYSYPDWTEYQDEIYSARVEATGMTSTLFMFGNCRYLKSIDFSGFDTSDVTEMGSMFNYCTSLETLDLRGFNTSKVTSMNGMFSFCLNLTTVNLSGFNTSNVTDMNRMFFECQNLANLDLSSFDASKVTTADEMFGQYGYVKEIDTPRNMNFDVEVPSTYPYIFKSAEGVVYDKLPKDISTSIHLSEVGPEFMVVYNGNGATSGSMLNQTVEYGSGAVAKDCTFVRKGYKFAGWDKEIGTQEAPIFAGDRIDLQCTNDKDTLTLYARWIEEIYRINYGVSGGLNSSANPETYTINTPTITLQDPTFPGQAMIFCGWYTDSNYTNRITEIPQGTTGTITVYAKWEADTPAPETKYSISYVLEGGTNDSENPTSYYPSTATITLKAPTREGYTFEGWYRDAAYTSKITQIPTGSTGDIMLYAKWKKNTPSYIYNGVDYSPVFDAEYYLNKYTDLRRAYGTDANKVLVHFLNFGMQEGRQGSAGFDVNSYRNQYADLRRAFGTDLKRYYMHYITNGKREGRKGTGCTTLQNGITVYNGVDYKDVYDFTYYTTKYPDIKKAFGNDENAVLDHFVNFGMREGRQGKANFDVNSYRNQYADLRCAFGTDLKSYYLHYMRNGKKEGRKGTGCTALQNPAVQYNGIDYSAVYNYNYYLTKYPDVKKACGGDDNAMLKYFVETGMAKGHRGSANFDVNSYRYQYWDLRRAFGTDLKSYYMHYITNGKKEGRKGTGCTTLQNGITVYNGVDYKDVYDFTYYTTKYADIKRAFGNDENAVLAHFVNCGMKEGRQGSANFDVNSYRNQYSDLRRAFGTTLKSYYMHYITNGKKEGRKGTGCTALQNGITVYNGVDYKDVYDFSYYTTKYADIKRAFGNDEHAVLAHFVNCGMKEGRQGSANFDVNSYRNQYSDLRRAFGTDLKSYYMHYINCGKKEGRSA